MFKSVQYASLLAYLSPTLAFGATIPATEDLNRETEFSGFAEQELEPFFESGDEQWITGEKGLSLRLRTFLQDGDKAIVMAHGFVENINRYKETIYDFYQAGYSIFAYDHRGHGASDLIAKNPDVGHVDRWDNYVKDFSQVVELASRDFDKIYLFGHSMGGAVVTTYLQGEPNPKVAKAVLSAPMHEIPTDPYPKLIARGIVGSAVLIGLGEKWAPGEGPNDPETWTIDTFNESRSKARVDYYIAEMKALGWGSRAGASNNWVKEVLDATKRMTKSWQIKKISTPLLILQASDDDFALPGGQEKVCAEAPSCKLVQYENSFHSLFIEVDRIRVPYFQDIFKFLAE
ncbi:alpha/beta fold hydrolase [Pseudobacteriovorax antillogorgiicola]|uniref:Lysophospholipase n=1 Tax=Pseudobacteriovorax antillogorgiicola TaxID=1513793 RepID=A0A1Y6C9D9_9BACT|nr:alpha/beta hydrolase [Pseudobacteriovorax antillogorgiicola]TCS49031.1 lysophospholipase [Pseudobacteriovorax antillogorgiicola]SMF52752.1 lysophospholipase [Pseudobacteriovorax antillogorgiicola]